MRAWGVLAFGISLGVMLTLLAQQLWGQDGVVRSGRSFPEIFLDGLNASTQLETEPRGITAQPQYRHEVGGNATTAPVVLQHPYWDSRTDSKHSCCGAASLGDVVYKSTPNDISELLPIWELYVKDPHVETIVEAGSFTGVSTTTLMKAIRQNNTKHAATMDLTITSTVEFLYKCEEKCGGDGRKLFTVEGSDLVTPIPFVDLEPRPDKGLRPIDLLFIDTLHNGDHLYMELLRFARHVKQRILFHDVSSFIDHDERPIVVPPNFSTLGVPRPVGLRKAIEMFLTGTAEGEHWVEEVVFRHNNGLYVLRRRSWAIDAAPLLTSRERSSGGALESSETSAAFAALEGKYSSNFPAFRRGLMELCLQFVGLVYKYQPTVGVWNNPKKRVQRHCSRRKWMFVTPFQRAMAQLPFPLQTTLGLVNGLVKSMLFFPAAASTGPVTVVCGGCHASILHILSAETRSLSTLPAANATAVGASPQPPSRISIAVLSTVWLNSNFDSYASVEAFLYSKVTHRIVIYGGKVSALWRVLEPSSSSHASTAPGRFEAKSVHFVDAGIVYYERVAATEYHYVQINESSVPLRSARGGESSGATAMSSDGNRGS